MFRKSLQFKISLIVGVILAIILGISYYMVTYNNIKNLREDFEETTRRQAVLLTEAIYHDITYAIEKGHMKSLVDMTKLVESISEIQQLIIFSPDGEILQSLHEEDIGKTISDIHMSVYQHSQEKGKAYAVGQSKSFCMVKPIYNKAECHNCHGKEKELLGVLDVCLSMASTEEKVAAHKKFMILSEASTAIITIFLTAVAIFLSLRLIVHRPINQLVKAMSNVENGDLEVVVKINSKDELGRLGSGFNSMIFKIKELNEAKSDFISIVSHELRTPLTSIKYFAEVLLERIGNINQKQQHKFLNIINEESDRLTRLINDLLDLQKIEAGKLKWAEKKVNITEVIKKSIGTFTGAATLKNISLITSFPKKVPLLIADQDKLTQVMANLFSNAIKFTAVGGHIYITIETKEDTLLPADNPLRHHIQVSVQDEGKGIDGKNLDRIFERFEQVDSSITRKEGGTGLGLSICKEIVRHYGGKIWVESKVGMGSTFSFILPYIPKEDA